LPKYAINNPYFRLLYRVNIGNLWEPKITAMQPNEWKRYHDSLNTEKSKVYKAEIERVLCISQSAFYRKIKHPEKFLTIADKWAIARIYGLDELYLFPELKASK
jgi:hypothetical protein